MCNLKLHGALELLLTGNVAVTIEGLVFPFAEAYSSKKKNIEHITD